MDIPQDIASGTASIHNRQIADLLAKMWAKDRADKAEFIANGGSFCPRCHCRLKPGQTCHCKPSAGSVPAPAQAARETALFEETQARIELITTELETKPWLMLRDVRRKLPDATWNDFAAARARLEERLRKEAWRIMDTLPAGAPLPEELRRLCAQIVATHHGRSFDSCGAFLINSALKPKLAEAYLTNKACPWDNSAKKA